MKIEDHILQLMVKKLTGDICVEEVQELNKLLISNPDAYILMELLLYEWAITEQVSITDSRRLFAKIMSCIKQTSVAAYKN